jgi:hypothetical protein
MNAPSVDALLALAAAGRHDELRLALADLPAGTLDAFLGTLVGRGDAATLAALDADGLRKPARKAVRRALHALKAKGVRVAEAQRVGRIGPTATAEAEGLRAEAYLSLPRPSVDFILVVRTAADRHLFVALLDEEERIVEGGAYPGATKQGVRGLLQRQEAAGYPFVPIPPEHVAARLRAAAARPPSTHGDRAGLVRAEIADRLAVFASLADAEHPALALAPAEPSEQEAEAQLVAGHFAPRDLPFPLDSTLLRGLIERLNAVRTSPLLLAPGAKGDRELDVIREFAERELPPGVRETLALRFLDRAWASAKRREDRVARAEASCGALLLRRPASTAAHELLARFVMAHVRPPERDEEPDAPDEPRDAERRSSGGLILP